MVLGSLPAAGREVEQACLPWAQAGVSMHSILEEIYDPDFTAPISAFVEGRASTKLYAIYNAW